MDRLFRNLFNTIITVLFLGFICACSHDDKMDHDKYVAQINKWHQKRIDALKEDDSWLSLAGLFELKEGTHSFGSDSTNDIVFPPKAASKIGTITRKDSLFHISVNPTIEVTFDGEPVSDIDMKTSEQVPDPTNLTYQSLSWYIIKRRTHYYIRLKDAENPNFTSFEDIDRFPVSQKWRAKATFNRFEQPKTITIPDVLGETFQDSLYGTLEFSLEGQQFSLAPIGNPDTDDEFFIILGDKTNGNSTYGGGRYIYVPTPDKNGITYIDFNKAYNPPCAFTHFATCPLPPAQNRLSIKVTAGEQIYEFDQ